MSEGCQIELRLIVIAITEKDVNTELRCRTQNQAGRQEVVTHLQLEGKTELSLFNVTVISNDSTWLQVTELMLNLYHYVITGDNVRTCKIKIHSEL